MNASFITADALDGLRQLADESIDCCVTSPPYFGLRDYGVDGQIGLEDSPEAYVSKLNDVFHEVHRVLSDHGTLWINIGDSYAGSRKGGATHPENAGSFLQGTNRGMVGQRAVAGVGYGECKDKDLIGIPWMLAFALRADGWYLRSEIIWAKPNPMPESVKDRCTKSHEHVFMLTKIPRGYYFDAEAIAEPVAESTVRRLSQDVDAQEGSLRVLGKTNGTMKAVAPRFGGKKYTENQDIFFRTKSGNIYEYKPMRNKRDVWKVPTVAYREAHFATYPTELIRPCIRAGCPKDGIVLDPFIGSGTTALVALEEQRSCIGIDINAGYIEIAKRRIDGLSVQTRLEESK